MIGLFFPPLKKIIFFLYRFLYTEFSTNGDFCIFISLLKEGDPGATLINIHHKIGWVESALGQKSPP